MRPARPRRDLEIGIARQQAIEPGGEQQLAGTVGMPAGVGDDLQGRATLDGHHELPGLWIVEGEPAPLLGDAAPRGSLADGEAIGVAPRLLLDGLDDDPAGTVGNTQEDAVAIAGQERPAQLASEQCREQCYPAQLCRPAGLGARV